MLFFPNYFTQVPGTKYYCTHSENGKRHLTPVTSKLPAIGHAGVFNKIQLKSTADNLVMTR